MAREPEMAPPRTFSYERLKRLIRDQPTWTYPQYAAILTEDNRRTDPGSPRVKPDSVRRVVSQYRAEWEEEGIRFPARGTVNTDLLPPTGSIAPNQRMSTPLRYLREISKQRRGEQPYTDTEAAMRRQALRWEEKLRANREIVDFNDHGTVLVRPARADELDDSGQLRELVAWVLPGGEPPKRLSLRGRG
jgi:hypothetical protein